MRLRLQWLIHFEELGFQERLSVDAYGTVRTKARKLTSSTVLEWCAAVYVNSFFYRPTFLRYSIPGETDT